MSKEGFYGVIIAVALLLIGVVSLWFSPNSILRPRLLQRQVVKNQTNQVTPAEEANSNQVTVDISAVEYKFSQNVIKAKVGQKIVVTLHNDGAHAHDFTVNVEDGKYSTKILEPGMAETIEFSVEKSGEYDFYCSLAGHREQGMEGTLVVK